MDLELSLIGSWSKERSVNLDARRLVNWFVAIGSPGARSRIAAFPTPGLSLAFEISGNLSRGDFAYNDVLYSVTDDKFSSTTTGLVTTERGTLLTSTGRVKMACNGLEVMVVDGTYGYIYTIATGVFARITDTDFPANPLDVTIQDSVFVVITRDNVYASDVLAGSSWSALSFASAEGDPDKLVACISDHRELMLLGDTTTEFFYNAGTTPFTFARNTGAFLQKGCAARFSVAAGDNSVFWLTNSPQGPGLVVRLSEGYQPRVVSTPAINERIARLSSRSDAFGYVYQEAGHEFYVLTFPTDNVTLCYDVTSSALAGADLWHERSTFEMGRHISNTYAFFNGKHIVGDYTSGKRYYMSQDYLDDNGTLIQRVLVSQHQHNQNRMLFANELEILMETGVGLITGNYTDPKMTIEVSRDGGHTFESYGTISIGKMGQYNWRAIIRRLGRARVFTFRLTIADPVRCYLTGARANYRAGIR